MTDTYSLNIYSSAKDGKAYIGECTDLAAGWRRSIRVQGGFWEGSFSIVDQPLSVCQQFFYNYRFAHFAEKSGSDVTWEGFISKMRLDDSGFTPRLDVTVCGYVFTLNWRLVTAGDGATGYASTWITDIINTDVDAAFVTLGRIADNTLTVYRDNKFKSFVWDELQKIAGLGDANAIPWHVYVDVGQKLNYNAISNSPRYFVRGGVVRDWDADDYYSAVQGEYTNDSGASVTIAEITNASSIQRYGKRTYYLSLSGVTAAAAAAKAATILKESAIPRPHAVGSTEDLELVTESGEDLIESPWKIRPGVYRDAQNPVQPYTAVSSTDWLLSEGDFLVDEVEVSADSGISLRTSYADEADILEAQQEYQEEYKEEMKRAAKKKKKKEQG